MKEKSSLSQRFDREKTPPAESVLKRKKAKFTPEQQGESVFDAFSPRRPSSVKGTGYRKPAAFRTSERAF